MSRSLGSICRSLAAFNARLSTKTLAPLSRYNFAMAHLSTNAMAHTAAVNGQSNTWQGSGAAEFDLRSMNAPLPVITLD